MPPSMQDREAERAARSGRSEASSLRTAVEDLAAGLLPLSTHRLVDEIDACPGIGGHVKPSAYHQRRERHGFQRNGLPARIRTGEEQDGEVAAHAQVVGDAFAARDEGVP